MALMQNRRGDVLDIPDKNISHMEALGYTVLGKREDTAEPKARSRSRSAATAE